jgi:signal peptidase complex subunit 3
LFRRKTLVAVIHRLQLNTLRSLKSHGGVDRALLSFDIDVDLSPAFHWNVKQLFVYVVAHYDTYETQKDGTVRPRANQVVLWDKIVESAADDDGGATTHNNSKRIKESNVFVKYALIDAGAELRGKDVTLQLQWDFMPITGMLYIDQQPLKEASRFSLPSEYR